jgi:hypothetical protein
MSGNRITRGKGLIGQVFAGQVTSDALNVGSGTNVKKIETGAVDISFASIPATATASAEFTLTGAAAGDVVLISGLPAFSSASVSLSHAGATADKGIVWALNASSASVSASAAMQYIWLDVT